MDDLITVVEDYCELKVEIKEVSSNYASIVGELERYTNSANIFIRADLNYCYRCYVVAKELSQLIIDTEDSYTKDVGALVAGLVDGSYQQINDDEALQSENFAHYAACELLLPFELRDRYLKEIAAVENTHYKIADLHKIPEQIVKQVLYAPIQDSLRPLMDPIDNHF